MDTLNLHPYTKVDGVWTFTDSFINEVWDNLRLKEVTFSSIDLDYFDPVVFFKRNAQLYIGTIETEKGPTVVGAIWIYDYKLARRSGYFGFAFVEQVEDKKTKFALAQTALGILLDQDDYRILLAEISKSKEKALQMAMALGFRQVGIIPNGAFIYEDADFEDLHILYLTGENLK